MIPGSSLATIPGSGLEQAVPRAFPHNARDLSLFDTARVRTAAGTLTGDARAPGASADRRPASTGARPVQSHRPDSPIPPEEISNADRAAIARYAYLLETADPHEVEQMHREAFDRPTPAQREKVHQRMRTEFPAKDQPRTSGADDLARTAARAEARRPGFLRGLLSRAVVSLLAGPLREQASSMGVDFETRGNSVDLEGVTGGLGEFTANAGETVSGAGEQIGNLGSNFPVPGLDDLFGR